VSEEVNRKLHAGNTTVKLLTLHTDPECHNALQRYQRTDGRTTLWCELPIILPGSTIG